MADSRAVGSGVGLGDPLRGPRGETRVTLSGKAFREAEMCITADLARLPEVRSFADSCAASFGFGDDIRYQIKMAMSEAVANAVEHGSPTPGDSVRVRAV